MLYDYSRLQKDGFRPEKRIYAINESGRRRFSDLMHHFSSRVTPFYLETNAFLFHIECLPPDEGLALLRDLQAALYQLKLEFQRHETDQRPNRPFAARAIAKQYRMLVDTLLTWCEQIADEYAALHQLEGE